MQISSVASQVQSQIQTRPAQTPTPNQASAPTRTAAAQNKPSTGVLDADGDTDGDVGPEGSGTGQRLNIRG